MLSFWSKEPPTEAICGRASEQGRSRDTFWFPHRESPQSSIASAIAKQPGLTRVAPASTLLVDPRGTSVAAYEPRVELLDPHMSVTHEMSFPPNDFPATKSKS